VATDGSTAEFGDDVVVTEFVIPRIPASAGALIADGEGRILILKPTYKSGWTIPGGQIEENGESPWEGCRREVLEETGLTVTSGRLACVDFLRPRARRPGGLRFLFDCGSVGGDQKDRIVLQAEEIQGHRWVDADEAARRLSGPVGRRVGRVLAATGPLYLEEGIPVAGVGG
jgi:8-oxo-dGTP pyrophosphatase MutT (NUDIX family)